LLDVIAATLGGSKGQPHLKSVALAHVKEEGLVDELFYRCLFYQ
jgi:hypothetical protein